MLFLLKHTFIQKYKVNRLCVSLLQESDTSVDDLCIRVVAWLCGQMIKSDDSGVRLPGLVVLGLG